MRLDFGEYDVPDYPNPANDLALWNAYCAAWNHYWDIRALCAPEDFPASRQLTQHAYPGQPARQAEHVPLRCTCTYWAAYGLVWEISTRRPVQPDRTAHASGFTIDPACPHHGHLAHTHLIERMWESPYQYGLLRDPYDLDDDERR
jgi:hypothetical protein